MEVSVTVTYNVGIPGLGVTIAYSTTSGGTYTPVGQLQSIDGVDFSVGTWDSTGTASVAKEKLATIFDAGDFGFKCIFNPSDATHVYILTSMSSIPPTLLYWKFTFPSPVGPGASAPETAKTYVFPAWITGYNVSGFEPESDAVLAVKLSITGQVTVA